MDILNQNGTTRRVARVRKGAHRNPRTTHRRLQAAADEHLQLMAGRPVVDNQPSADTIWWWRKGHAAIFKVKFGRKSKTAISQLPQSRERTAEQLFDHLESVALAVAGNDDPSEPTAKCINDTKKGNWWPDLDFQSWGAVLATSTTSVQWSHPLQLENSSRRCFNKCVHHFKVDVIAENTNAAAYRYYKDQVYQDLYNSSVACSTNTHPSTSRSKWSWLLLHGHSLMEKASRTQNPGETWESYCKWSFCNFARARSWRLAKPGGPME